MTTKNLSVGEYTASEKFRRIERHACVCESDGAELVAVTGPAGDREAVNYAYLFAAAPELLESCEELLAHADGGQVDSICHKGICTMEECGQCQRVNAARAAINKAKSGAP